MNAQPLVGGAPEIQADDGSKVHDSRREASQRHGAGIAAPSPSGDSKGRLVFRRVHHRVPALALRLTVLVDGAPTTGCTRLALFAELLRTGFLEGSCSVH